LVVRNTNHCDSSSGESQGFYCEIKIHQRVVAIRTSFSFHGGDKEEGEVSRVG